MKHPIIALTLLLGACDSTPQQPTPDKPAASAEQQLTTAAVIEDPADTSQRCRDEYQRLVDEPGLPGAPAFEAARVSLLTRVKAEPLLFVQKPAFDSDVSRDVRRFRGVMTSTPHAWDYLKVIVANFEHNPQMGRAVLLRDGYLYAEQPNLAYALVDHVRAKHLFDEPRFWIQRGGLTLHAVRQKTGEYIYEDGPQEGQPVQLLFLDRAGVGEPPPPLHRDVRGLRYRLHFDRFEPVALTEKRMAARLHYGGTVIPTVVKTEGSHMDLECEIVEPEQEVNLRLHRERGARLEKVVQGMRDAMIAEIEERLPFDEPLTEAGQQDGYLRHKWLSAYQLGGSRYEFNGDEYYVFDNRGQPLVPQVCVDFLTDTLERASGTWWRPRGQKRERVIGKLDFSTLAPSMPRRVPDFVEFARRHSEWFDVYDTLEHERIPFRKTNTFYKNLINNTGRYRPGDIIIIRGFTPFERKWERPLMHYHSFFVYESDPISGMPYLLVGNPGRPSMRTWEFEIRRTPKRSIWHRIRPQLFWLEQVVLPSTRPVTDPPPIAVGPVL